MIQRAGRQDKVETRAEVVRDCRKRADHTSFVSGGSVPILAGHLPSGIGFSISLGP